jgi:hypothetical protein
MHAARTRGLSSHSFSERAPQNFVEESGHVGHWVEVRHVEALKGGDKPESIRKEARQFQILNTVCDAANATFYQLYGDGYGSEAEIGSCSKKVRTSTARRASVGLLCRYVDCLVLLGILIAPLIATSLISQGLEMAFMMLGSSDAMMEPQQVPHAAIERPGPA